MVERSPTPAMCSLPSRLNNKTTNAHSCIALGRHQRPKLALPRLPWVKASMARGARGRSEVRLIVADEVVHELVGVGGGRADGLAHDAPDVVHGLVARVVVRAQPQALLVHLHDRRRQAPPVPGTALASGGPRASSKPEHGSSGCIDTSGTPPLGCAGNLTARAHARVLSVRACDACRAVLFCGSETALNMQEQHRRCSALQAAPLAGGAPGVLLDLADAQAPLRLADEDALDQVLALRRDARVLGELVVDAHDAVQHLGAHVPVMGSKFKFRQSL
jgi:hypothetical protein